MARSIGGGQVTSRTALDERCAILAPSCDAYADLWAPFVTLFFRNWPDCPFSFHLGANEASFAHPRVRMQHASHGMNWANRVRQQVEALETPYVLLMLEDFFLRRPVQTSRVLDALAALEALQGSVVRLVVRPGPDRPVPGWPGIGAIDVGAPYRVSTQAAIWRRDALLALMRPGESIWQFEHLGSRRSDTAEGFFGVWEDALTYDHHVVERGKWFPWEARRFGAMQIGCDFERRPIMAKGEAARWLAAKGRSLLLERLPWRTRERLRTISRAPGSRPGAPQRGR